MNIAICVTNFKNDLKEAISKNAVYLSAGLSENFNVVLLVPGLIDKSVKLPFKLTIENYGKKRDYKSKIRVLWNIIELGRYLKKKGRKYDLIHFQIGNLIEIFLLWLFLPQMEAIRVITVWQPYLTLSEFLFLPKMFPGQLLEIIHHCLINSCFHIPLFWIGHGYFHKIIVSSMYQKNQLKFLNTNKVRVIPNGVVRPDKVNTLISDTENKILYIGHGTAVKGIDVLLEAIQHIRKKMRISVTMALSDFTYNNVQNKIKEYGLENEIILRGEVDVYEEMRRHHLFVLPLKSSVGTTYYPNVLLECFASGLPIIVSSIEVIKEVVINGQTGIIIPPGSSYDLGRAIINLLSNKDMLRKLSAIQREEFEKKYTLDKYIEKHELLYRSLLTA